MAHSHIVVDTDTKFKIDPLTRAIRCENKKSILMQGDHNSERYSFTLERFIEGHDMSLCNQVEVHFANIDAKTRDKKTGVYTVDDFQIDAEDDTKVNCSWLISKNATQLSGTLVFLLNFRCLEEGFEKYSWHTDVYKSITIQEGIDAAFNFEIEYVDVIEQWKDSVISGFTTDLAQWKTKTASDVERQANEALDEYFAERNKRVFVQNEKTDNQGLFEGVNYAGQGERSDLYNFIIHNYTDSPIMRLDNVGSAAIMQVVNAHNAVRRSDKEETYHGTGDVLCYMVQADADGNGDYSQHTLFTIDKDGMPFWSGWDNANAGGEKQDKTVKFKTNKKDGNTWAYNFDATQLNKFLMLLSTGGLQVMQVKTDGTGICAIEAPNGARLTGADFLNLTSSGNILIQTGSTDVNAVRYRIGNDYFYPQFTNKICLSTDRPTTAAAGEIYLESDTNRTIRRNAANNGWVDMNGNPI